MKNIEIAAWIAILIVWMLIYPSVLSFSLSNIDLLTQIAASWIQAIFSVIAIIAALVISQRETREIAAEAREDRKHTADLAALERADRQEETARRAVTLWAYLMPQAAVLRGNILLSGNLAEKNNVNELHIEVPKGILDKSDILWLLGEDGEDILDTVAAVELHNSLVVHASKNFPAFQDAIKFIVEGNHYKSLMKREKHLNDLIKTINSADLRKRWNRSASS